MLTLCLHKMNIYLSNPVLITIQLLAQLLYLFILWIKEAHTPLLSFAAYIGAANMHLNIYVLNIEHRRRCPH